MWTAQRIANWDFKLNGMQLYHDHYAVLEQECRRQDRRWLDWTVEDGWAPLCEFLDKPAPETDFPSSNDQGDFAQRRAKIHNGRIVRAHQNMAITGAVVMAGIAGGIVWYRDREGIKKIVSSSVDQVMTITRRLASR